MIEGKDNLHEYAGDAWTTGEKMSENMIDNMPSPIEINDENLRRNNSKSETLYNMHQPELVPNHSGDLGYNSEEYTTSAPSFALERRSTTARQDLYEDQTPIGRVNTANTEANAITIYDTTYNVKPETINEDLVKNMSSEYNINSSSHPREKNATRLPFQNAESLKNTSFKDANVSHETITPWPQMGTTPELEDNNTQTNAAGTGLGIGQIPQLNDEIGLGMTGNIGYGNFGNGQGNMPYKVGLESGQVTELSNRISSTGYGPNVGLHSNNESGGNTSDNDNNLSNNITTANVTLNSTRINSHPLSDQNSNHSNVNNTQFNYLKPLRPISMGLDTNGANAESADPMTNLNLGSSNSIHNPMQYPGNFGYPYGNNNHVSDDNYQGVDTDLDDIGDNNIHHDIGGIHWSSEKYNDDDLDLNQVNKLHELIRKYYSDTNRERHAEKSADNKAYSFDEFEKAYGDSKNSYSGKPPFFTHLHKKESKHSSSIGPRIDQNNKDNIEQRLMTIKGNNLDQFHGGNAKYRKMEERYFSTSGEYVPGINHENKDNMERQSLAGNTLHTYDKAEANSLHNMIVNGKHLSSNGELTLGASHKPSHNVNYGYTSDFLNQNPISLSESGATQRVGGALSRIQSSDLVHIDPNYNRLGKLNVHRPARQGKNANPIGNNIVQMITPDIPFPQSRRFGKEYDDENQENSGAQLSPNGQHSLKHDGKLTKPDGSAKALEISKQHKLHDNEVLIQPLPANIAHNDWKVAMLTNERKNRKKRPLSKMQKNIKPPPEHNDVVIPPKPNSFSKNKNTKFDENSLTIENVRGSNVETNLNKEFQNSNGSFININTTLVANKTDAHLNAFPDSSYFDDQILNGGYIPGGVRTNSRNENRILFAKAANSGMINNGGGIPFMFARNYSANNTMWNQPWNRLGGVGGSGWSGGRNMPWGGNFSGGNFSGGGGNLGIGGGMGGDIGGGYGGGVGAGGMNSMGMGAGGMLGVGVGAGAMNGVGGMGGGIAGGAMGGRGGGMNGGMGGGMGGGVGGGMVGGMGGGMGGGVGGGMGGGIGGGMGGGVGGGMEGGMGGGAGGGMVGGGGSMGGGGAAGGGGGAAGGGGGGGIGGGIAGGVAISGGGGAFGAGGAIETAAGGGGGAAGGGGGAAGGGGGAAGGAAGGGGGGGGGSHFSGDVCSGSPKDDKEEDAFPGKFENGVNLMCMYFNQTYVNIFQLLWTWSSFSILPKPRCLMI